MTRAVWTKRIGSTGIVVQATFKHGPNRIRLTWAPHWSRWTHTDQASAEALVRHWPCQPIADQHHVPYLQYVGR